jgi:hypothetical protein
MEWNSLINSQINKKEKKKHIAMDNSIIKTTKVRNK